METPAEPPAVDAGRSADTPEAAPSDTTAAATGSPAAGDPEPEPEEEPQPRDALIYVPGIGGGFADRSVVGVGLRVARILDQWADDENLTFTFEMGTDQSEYAGGVTSAHTIRRKHVGDEASTGDPVIDVYHFDYGETMTSRWNERNALSQIFFLGLALLASLPRFLQAFFAIRKPRDGSRWWQFWDIRFKVKGKSPTQILQLAYASAIFVGLVVYFVLLVVAAIQVVDQRFDPGSSTAAGVTLAADAEVLGQAEPAAEASGDGITLVQQVVIGATALGAAFRKRRDRLTAAIVNYLSIVLYMTASERHGHIIGQLDGLIEHVAEQHDYRHIHIVAYSFGSVLAIDALFPGGVAPTAGEGPASQPPTRYQRVEALITVGSPYDFLRTLWPRYFRSRQSRPDVPKCWYNVYSPMDLLGSNFRNDRELAAADPEVVPGPQQMTPKNLVFAQGPIRNRTSLLDFLLIAGLRSHEVYWGADEEVDRNALALVIAELYEPDDTVVYG